VGLSFVFVGGLVLFALATLPVEIGASRRTFMLLRETLLADEREVRGVRRVSRERIVERHAKSERPRGRRSI
jgi:uncharacterized protein